MISFSPIQKKAEKYFTVLWVGPIVQSSSPVQRLDTTA